MMYKISELEYNEIEEEYYRKIWAEMKTIGEI